MSLFIGLMSGTSLDGVDAVLVQFEPGLQVLSEFHQPFPNDLRDKILQLAAQENWPRDVYAEVDVRLGHEYAKAVKALLKKAGVSKEQVTAIASHGQTIYHNPNSEFPVSYQVGDPHVLSVETGIEVVSDFRRRLVAQGEQGAPLVPIFHEYIYKDLGDCVVLNIGGIANISILKKGTKSWGFDTGPGNCLMDEYCRDNGLGDCDLDGQLATAGSINNDWLKSALAMDYFQQDPPKSTGRELFHLGALPDLPATSHEDALATLAELTIQSIVQAIQKQLSKGPVIVCGGGVHNGHVMQRLADDLAGHSVMSSEQAGVSINPDQMEAIAFGYLAWIKEM